MLAKALAAATASAPKVYVEDVFSTFLYTGNNSTQTIQNGIDLSGKGGLVWLKNRTASYGENHALYDSARGIGSNLVYKDLSTDSTGGQVDRSTVGLSALNSDGFTVISSNNQFNNSAYTYCSWTFRKAPKFFDVVTYTGNGADPRTISHNLGSVPGSIIVKRTDSADDWIVYHRSVTTGYLKLNTTNATLTRTDYIYQNPTSTTFQVGGVAPVNASGGTYVAYLFAHDAGGFGTAGTDNVVKCGSYTGTGAAGNRIELGWEPQFILYKAASTTGDWGIHDSMRGLGVGTSATSGSGNRLEPNTSDAESGSSNFANIDATGFTITASVSDINGSGQTYIYIAIRRGPMKTPTVGTQVFSAITSSGSAGTTLTTDFPLDFQIERGRVNVGSTFVLDRLRGVNTTGVNGMDGPYLRTNGTTIETSDTTRALSDSWSNVSFKIGSSIGGVSSIYYSFRRAPGFFDVVAYTWSGAPTVYSHNLGVNPELVILKTRSATGNWFVYSLTLGFNDRVQLNTTDAVINGGGFVTAVSPSTLSMSLPFGGGATFIAYLFATCPGVSKVFNFTGTGTTLQINCGFTSGARLVLIKRTDSTGDWYIWDSARGIISGNDPYLLLNSTAAEVTNTDYIDPYSAGFEISSTAPAAINANGGSYIGLAIA